jgi:hypothetical protein
MKRTPEEVMQRHEVTFTVTFADGSKLTRQGQVWSGAPVTNGRWVIPYEADPRDLRGVHSIYCVRETRRGKGDFHVDLRSRGEDAATHTMFANPGRKAA